MKIAYITAGAAGMYCGSCMHDNTLVNALSRNGTDVILIPTYTPIRTDEADASMERVFFGGINVYLQEKLALFRHTPRFLDRLLDNRALLKMVSRFSASTSAADLGSLTLSMLRGEEGNQRKELDKLIAWLRDDYKPDLVQITNSMFAGFARAIKKELGVPVLCSLQGEDLFLEDLVSPWKEQCLEELYRRAADVDGFVVNSEYYRSFMSDYLRVASEKIHVVPLGLNLSDFGEVPVQANEAYTIGYLARICPEKGTHIAVEAFIHLAELLGADKLRLRIAGYLGARDEAFAEGLKARLAEAGLSERVDFIGEVTREEKMAFLQSLDVFTVPAPYKEPKGLYVLEAMASGVPVVQPDHGAFPELVAYGGGLLHEPEDPVSLAQGLKRLYEDPVRRREMAREGHRIVRERFTDEIMARNTAEVYSLHGSEVAGNI